MMREKEFAKTGRSISDVGMGTYYDPSWIASAFFGWRRGEGPKVEAVRAGLESGVNLLDTAEIYRSEPLVARALRGRKREEVFLATKVWSNHLERDALLMAFEKSLRRLGTTYIDLYQVHWPNPRVPIRETMAAMDELIGAGKLMHAGVSNFNLRQLEEANSSLPKSELSSVQLDYSLIHRNVEDGVLQYCSREKIALLAYYPLGHGKLPSDQRLQTLSVKYGKTKAQIALQWLAQKPGVFPIPRASKVEHVRENSAASGWELSGEDRIALEQMFPRRLKSAQT